jgi:hypothetical protein
MRRRHRLGGVAADGSPKLRVNPFHPLQSITIQTLEKLDEY